MLKNLDNPVNKRNKEVFQLPELKANEFILDSKEHIIKQYKEMLLQDTSIEIIFWWNNLFENKKNIILIQNEIEKDYESVLNKYLKEELITSYTYEMNEQTNDMIKVIKNDRELLRASFEDIIIVEPDSILNDINSKMNNILNSIEKFLSFVY